MNRPIIFRAWHKGLRQMLYPPPEIASDPYCRDKDGGIVSCPTTVGELGWGRALSSHMTWNGRWYIEGELQDVEWMQYTGLKDKNGKGIYEGDILRVDDYVIGYVDYLAEAACYTLRHPKVPSYRLDLYVLDDPVLEVPGITTTARTCKINTNRLEIIGNLFQNPELFDNSHP